MIRPHHAENPCYPQSKNIMKQYENGVGRAGGGGVSFRVNVGGIEVVREEPVVLNRCKLDRLKSDLLCQGGLQVAFVVLKAGMNRLSNTCSRNEVFNSSQNYVNLSFKSKNETHMVKFHLIEFIITFLQFLILKETFNKVFIVSLPQGYKAFSVEFRCWFLSQTAWSEHKVEYVLFASFYSQPPV